MMATPAPAPQPAAAIHAALVPEVYVSVDVVCPERFMMWPSVFGAAGGDPSAARGVELFAPAPVPIRVPVASMGSFAAFFAALKGVALADVQEEASFLRGVGTTEWTLPPSGVVFAQERQGVPGSPRRWTGLDNIAALRHHDPVLVCGIREWRKIKAAELAEERAAAAAQLEGKRPPDDASPAGSQAKAARRSPGPPVATSPPGPGPQVAAAAVAAAYATSAAGIQHALAQPQPGTLLGPAQPVNVPGAGVAVAPGTVPALLGGGGQKVKPGAGAAAGVMPGLKELPERLVKKRKHKVHGPAFVKIFQMLQLKEIPAGSPTTLRDNSNLILGYADKGPEFGQLALKEANQTFKRETVAWEQDGHMNLLRLAGGAELRSIKGTEAAQRVFNTMVQDPASRVVCMWNVANECARLCCYGPVFKERKGQPFAALQIKFMEYLGHAGHPFPKSEAEALQLCGLD